MTELRDPALLDPGFRPEGFNVTRHCPRRVHASTYNSWSAMRQRCCNPRHHAWARYGGRGITVAERWASFENFLADMGPRPAGTSLDRIDNDGNYEPGNCRWATPKEQQRNTAKTRAIRVGDDVVLRIEAAERIGCGGSTIDRRLRRGWSAEDAVTVPPTTSNFAGGPRFIEHEGRRLTVSAWARSVGINRASLVKRLSSGMAFADAIARPINEAKRRTRRAAS